MMRHQTFDYTIDYLGSDSRKRGQEFCTLTVHEDGGRTLRARSEIFDSEVLRDVVYSVDAGFRPRDALLRVSVRDQFVGVGWFRFGDHVAECETDTAATGRLSQRIPLARPAASFLTHAVAADVWHGAGLRQEEALGPQPIEPLLSASPLHNGASGPMLSFWPLQGHYLGRETIDVPAGRFEAEHIRYEEPDGSLFLETWCTTDGNRIMLRMFYPPYQSSYVLASLQERARSAMP